MLGYCSHNQEMMILEGSSVKAESTETHTRWFGWEVKDDLFLIHSHEIYYKFGKYQIPPIRNTIFNGRIPLIFDAKDDEVTPSSHVSFIWGKVSHNDVTP